MVKVASYVSFSNFKRLMSIETNNQKPGERYFYLDWMRFFAILIVFLFHNLKFYDFMDWHIKNSERCEVATQIVNFFSLWIMPLFFTISGASAVFFIKHRNFKQVVSNRSKRLLFPYLFGIFVLILPQKYYEALFNKTLEGNFMDMFINWFNVFNIKIGFSPVWFGYFGYHLWFLAFLFIISVITYPLLLRIGKGLENHRLSFMDKFTGEKNYLPVLCIPLLVIDFIFRVPFPDYLNWADFFDFMYFFILGFLLFSNKKMMEVVKKNAWNNLYIGIVSISILGYLAMFTDFTKNMVAAPAWSFQYFGFVLLLKLNAFFWTIALLGIGALSLNFSTKHLYKFNEFVLPFYMLHQTLIIAIGFYIITWKISIVEKFLLITSLSFVSITLIYLVIQRFNILRLFFGMKRNVA